MVAEVYAGLSALKAAFDIAKGLKDVDDATRRNAAIIELQEKLLTAQFEQSSLIESVNELKRRVADFEKWDGEAERYDLKDAGNGALAYAYKQEANPPEPFHYICPACYQDRKNSILQPFTSRYSSHLFCPSCKLDLTVG